MREASEGRSEHKPISRFENLKVYQTGVDLAVSVYGETARWPDRERFGIVGQIRRAAVSVVLNIAEGYGRKDSVQELRHFLRIALGSCNEVMACLDIARKLEYYKDESLVLKSSYEVLAKQIFTLTKKWQ
jgi:four helix bundle protein